MPGEGWDDQNNCYFDEHYEDYGDMEDYGDEGGYDDYFGGGFIRKYFI